MPMALGLGLGLPYIAAASGPYPTLDLNFAASGTLDPRVTYSGASLATLTNAAGAIAYKPHNLLTYSEDLTNAAWSKSNTSTSLAASASPTGGTAYVLVENSSTIDHRISSSATVVVGMTYTTSVYLKAAGRTAVKLYSNMQGGTKSFVVDLTTGGISASSMPSTPVCTSVGAGWWRVSYTEIADITSAIGLYVVLMSAGLETYAGDGASGVYVWGAQLNIGPLQPYYPTTSAAYYGPRFTYDPVTHAALGLLIEEQRTNLLTGSGNVGGASWTTSGALTVTQNAVAGPAGGTTATRIQTTGAASVYQNITVAASTAYTLTFYALNNGGTLAQYSVYDVSHAANIFAETTYLPSINGSTWTRVTVSFTTPAGCVSVNVYPIRATGSGADLYLDCAQLEAGAFATSYIPTTSASVTRAADSATMTGSNFSSWFNATEGTFIADMNWSNFASITPVMCDVSDATAQNQISLYLSGSVVVFVPKAAGANQAVVVPSGSQVAGVTSRAGAAYKLDDFRAVSRGGAVSSDTLGSVPSGLMQMGIGRRGNSNADSANAPISRLRYYTTALTNAQLQALTT